MTEMMTLSDLTHAIEDREAVKHDLIVSPTELAVLPPTEDRDSLLIQTGGDGFHPMGITDLAHDQIANWSPLGRRYYQLLQEEEPELWADNVNTWLGKGDKPRMLRTQNVTTGNGIRRSLRAFLSDQYGRFEDIHLMTPVLERIQDRGWEVSHCALTEKRMHIRVGFPTMQGEVKVGDIVQAGAAFTNSEVGHGTWKSEFFIERLVCLNGMKFPEMFAGFSRRHITGRQGAGWLSPSTLALENELLQSKVADTLDMMADKNQFEKVLMLMKDTTAQEIEQPMEAVQVLAQRAGLSNNERLAVEGNLVRGGDSTLWGLVNALTATAKDIPGFDRRAELEDAAGKMMTRRSTWNQYTEAVAA